MTIEKEKLIDLLLRIHYVNNYPTVRGTFIMTQSPEMERNFMLSFHDEFADMCEAVGLPRKLPKPTYPKQVWAAFKKGEPVEHCSFPGKEIFSGTCKEVHDWVATHENEYSYVSTTDRTMISEQEAFEVWKIQVLKEVVK